MVYKSSSLRRASASRCPCGNNIPVVYNMDIQIIYVLTSSSVSRLVLPLQGVTNLLRDVALLEAYKYNTQEQKEPLYVLHR